MLSSLIDIPMPIITPRLRLRLLNIHHSPEMFEARRESYVELSKLNILIWRPLDEMTLEENDNFILMKLKQFEERKDITILAFQSETGRLIGGGGLHKCDWENRIFSLGFWVRTNETGKGYATEIASALIQYAFSVLSANSLITHHEDRNLGSQKVIKKIGFALNGIQDNFVTYKMTSESWGNIACK
jgi:ribosomal-protein-serine acetyltransferase